MRRDRMLFPRHVGFLQWNAVVWRLGGKSERIVLLLYVLTVAFLVSVLLGFAATSNSPLPFEFYVTVGIAVTNILTLRVAFDMALYTKDSWRELLRRGHFYPNENVASDYLRYLETRGNNGRLPGGFRWALGICMAYYGLVAAAVLFTFSLLPVLGPLTPAAFLCIDAPVVLALGRVYRSRMLEALELLDLNRNRSTAPRSVS